MNPTQKINRTEDLNNEAVVPLSYGNVKLVLYEEEHDAQTVLWLNEKEVRQSFGLTRNVTLASHRGWLSSQKNFLIWAILDDKGQHQGNISLQLSPRHKSAYLQIYIGNPSARGKGMGQDVLRCVLGYFFRHLRLHRVWLHTAPDNIAAIQLYRKCGFVREGIERESILRDGQYDDQWRWSILASEWDLLQTERHP